MPPRRSAAWTCGAVTERLDPAAIPALLAGARRDSGSSSGSGGGELRPGQATVSTSTAAFLGARTGDRISLRTPGGGKLSARVALIHPDTASALGDIAVLPRDFAKLAPRAPVRALYITAADRDAPMSLRGPLDTALPLDPSLHLTYPGEERLATQQLIGQLRITALGLVGITVLVSLVGVAITLTLSSMERARENGVLRALGMRASRLRSVLTWEAGLLGLYAAVPGIALGALYGTLILGALPGLGSPTIPYGQLAITLVAALTLAPAASVLPASRTAAASPMFALRGD